ncbi:MAG: hypothetical protein LBR66_09015 [Candidatus Symbiothrix sp.]|jgi:hypothetical protein|nr:hypothetical protein [Candidatus Symbiothrix sp.]
MKKFIFMLSVMALPLVFSSCDSEEIEKITGNVSLTVDGKTIEIPAATFTIFNDRVMVVASNGSHSVAMYVDATSAGEYTLGICKSILDVGSAISGITKITTGSGNYLLYAPSSDVEQNAKIILIGSVNFTSFSSSRIEGNFAGTAFNYDEMMNLKSDLTALLSLVSGAGTSISGTFSANKIPGV